MRRTQSGRWNFSRNTRLTSITRATGWPGGRRERKERSGRPVPRSFTSRLELKFLSKLSLDTILVSFTTASTAFRITVSLVQHGRAKRLAHASAPRLDSRGFPRAYSFLKNALKNERSKKNVAIRKRVARRRFSRRE